jgi:FemAB-related protein (PEP-CTERM system-associated)
MRVLRNAYALDSHGLLAREDSTGAIVGVVPLAVVPTLRGRRELVSLPYHDSAGILTADPVAFGALLEEALRLAQTTRCAALELRQAEAAERLAAATGEQSRVDLVLPLESDEDAQWKALGAKVRNQTRKAEREGLAIARWDRSRLVEAFYAPFAVNMRDLGSPVHSRRFFEAIEHEFGNDVRFIVVCDADRPVGGLVAIHYAGRVTVPWASTLRSERNRCPNNLIYWEAIRWAISLGAREFDFGRSPRGEGTYRFKIGWGATERPLHWARLGPRGEPLPLPRVEEGSTLERLSRLWARLPVGVTRILGPPIRRRISN